MKDLYDRLVRNGIDATFVRDVVLPDWWSDDLAQVPANRSIAEMAIARHFGCSIAELRDRTRALQLPDAMNVRLKRCARTTNSEVAGSVAVARRAAELVAELSADLPAYDGPSLASAIRAAILRNNAFVELSSLLTFCWGHGIPIIHLIRTPTKSKRISGLATFCKSRPVIVLASGRDSPPWLAFHLAHELAHIMRDHVRRGAEPLVDQNIDKPDQDPQEQEAEKFACETLTGEVSLAFRPEYGLTAEKLAFAALRYGEKPRISPGTVVLIYGHSANRWGPAQKALACLQQDTGAHDLIMSALRENLPLEDLPETTERFLNGCARLMP